MQVEIKYMHLVLHDQGFTGIKYKLVVTLTKKYKKKELGGLTIDLGNLLYRSALRFKYTHDPEVNNKGTLTQYTYYFNDTKQMMHIVEILRLRPIFSDVVARNYIRTELKHHNKYPAYSAPYYYPDAVAQIDD